MATSTTCQQCGVLVAAGARFCANCGADVSAEQGNVATRKFTATQAMHDQLLQRVRHAALGEHEILTELGRGGMATVYLAHDIQLDRKVAIKVMLPSLLEGDDMVERFRLEARTAAALSHPHIIPIYAVRTGEGLVYFVMKFVEGRPLDAIVRELGKLPVPMVQSILSKVGEALGYAHRRGVVHRDIKPANLMIDVEGLPVVTDFGIAKVADSHGLTMTGAMIGTPTYMSPEQASGGEITGSSDQYSLGVVAFQMLAGRVPFEGDTLVGLLYKHCHEAPPHLLSLRPDCPPALAAAVMKMLEKDPADRFPTMEAAVDAIGAVSLAFDDPIRTQLISLALRGGNTDMLKRVSTPSSPVPLRARSQRSVAVPTVPAATVPTADAAPRNRPSRSAVIGTLAGVLGVSALLLWQPWKGAAPTTPTENQAASPTGAVGPSAPGTSPTATGDAPAPRPESLPAPAIATVPSRAVSLRIDAPRTSLTVGETTTLRAVPLDAANSPLSGRSVRWTSSDPSRAQVSAQGVVTARAPGDVTITARADDATRTVPMQIAALRAASVRLSAPPALRIGGTAQLTATVQDATGRPVVADVAWRSSNTAVAVVDGGRITATGAGTAEVTAIADGQQASVTVTVAAPEPVAAPDPVVSTPPSAPASVPVRAEPTAAETRAAIEAAVQRYARALATQQLSEIRAAYPGMTADEEARTSQSQRNTRDWRVTLNVGTVNVRPTQATAAVTGFYEFYSIDNRRNMRLPVEFTVTLERGPSQWSITSMRSPQ